MSSHHISTKRMKLEKLSSFVNPFEYVHIVMILTQTWAIGLLLNSHTVKHANCYGSSHYFLKILFINHTYKIQTNKGKAQGISRVEEMSSHHISTKRMKLEKLSSFVNPFEYVHIVKD
jgi:hypothetical protein